MSIQVAANGAGIVSGLIGVKMKLLRAAAYNTRYSRTNANALKHITSRLAIRNIP